MSKKARWVLALLIGAGGFVAGSAGAQPILVVDGPRPGQAVAGFVAVHGWVLSPRQIDKIEIFIDGNDVPVNRALLGLPRGDVVAAFPSYAAGGLNVAPGWISSFLARNYTDGSHSLTVAVTESGAQTPAIFGPIDVEVDNAINQYPFGSLDLPGAGKTVGANGSFQVVGWALDDSDINHIDFLVDGLVVAAAVGRGGIGTAVFGGTRPDVFAAFPVPGSNPRSLYSGFAANIDTTNFLNGLHELAVTAYDTQGASSSLGKRLIQVNNNGNLLTPFGALEYPDDEATLICGPAVPLIPVGGPCPSPCFPGGGGGGVPSSFFPNLVRGWSLDVGARLDEGQVSYVELMFDGALLANTRSDCLVTGNFFANCYGLSRPDIARAYPNYPNSASSGFQFTFGLARDPLFGFFEITIPTPQGVAVAGFTLPGTHTLSLRVGDEESTVTEFGAISVDMTCDTSTNPDQASFGNIDAPAREQSINGTWPVFGWAYDLDAGGVTRVDVAVDGVVLATLTPGNGYAIRRDDVPVSDPRVPTPNVGFAYALNTLTLADTEHSLTILAYDRALHRTLIGRRKFVVFNNTSVE